MKILVLGIGNAQVDLIKLLSKDHTVHALSYSRKGRGLEFTHHFKKVDIRDEKKVESYAKKHAIELVYSVGSDLGMVTSAKVSYNLGIPSFISPEVASICHKKHLLRAHLDGTEGNLDHKVLNQPDDIGDFKLPCIIKPVDSQGQRGVYFVETKKQLEDKFNSVIEFSDEKKAIAERYIHGSEVSVNAYVIKGKIVFSIISDRIVWPEYPGGLIQKHRIPSQFINTESKAKINTLVEDVVKKIGVKNGPVYFQIKLKGNNPKLIEVTPRLDGCHLWRLIEYAAGVNLLETTVNHIMEADFDKITFKKPDKSWILEFMCKTPQTALDKESYDLGNPHFLEWYYKNGDIISPINTYLEKCGYKIYNS